MTITVAMGNADAIRFGTDGWRGVIAQDFTFDNLRRVAHATADYFVRDHRTHAPTVFVGFDRRFFSPEFAQCVAGVFQRHGIRVSLGASPMPTPAVSVMVKDRSFDWGIMITASHNPALYNGFKIKDRHGRSAPPEVTRRIEEGLSHLESAPATPPPTSDIPSLDYREVYENYLKSRLDWTAIRSVKGSVVFDYLFGVSAGIPGRLLARTSLKVIDLHVEHDPLFGALHPEPIESQLGALQKEVKRRKALMGIALDGDADRLGLVDDRGMYMTPHQVFPLLTLHCIEHKGWRGKIVQSVSLGALGERIAAHYDLPFEEVPVGFKHVAERMLREDILAGGEESGGYALRGGLPERDGILSGLLFLEMLGARQKKLSQLLADMEKRFGQARFHRVDLHLRRPIQDKTDFVERVSGRLPDRLGGEPVADIRSQDGLKIRLKSGAWVLLRPSGTEPLLRTYAESDQWKKTHTLLHWARQTVLDLYEKN